MAYFGLSCPHSSYSITVRGASLLRLFRLQKIAIRTICKLKVRDSRRQDFIVMGLLTVPCFFILDRHSHVLSEQACFDAGLWDPSVWDKREDTAIASLNTVQWCSSACPHRPGSSSLTRYLVAYEVNKTTLNSRFVLKTTLWLSPFTTISDIEPPNITSGQPCWSCFFYCLFEWK